MKLEPEILVRDVPDPGAVRERLLTEALDLEHYCEQIVRCRVVAERSHQTRAAGNLYRVLVDVTVPGDEVVVARAPDAHHEHEDLDVAIQDAFRAARRRLQDWVRRRRWKVKQHEPVPHARVARVYPQQDYGFLETPDGREVYFHRNAVLHGEFDALDPGASVEFREEPGEKGPQATMVRVPRTTRTRARRAARAANR